MFQSVLHLLAQSWVHSSPVMASYAKAVTAFHRFIQSNLASLDTVAISATQANRCFLGWER